jgi:hypothetical protein
MLSVLRAFVVQTCIASLTLRVIWLQHVTLLADRAANGSNTKDTDTIGVTNKLKNR